MTGSGALRQVGTIIPPQYYKLAIVLGWSAKAVDTLARRCNLDSFVWPDGDLESLGYADVAQGNHLSTEVSSGIISSLIHGVSFLVNTRGDESAVSLLALDPCQGCVQRDRRLESASHVASTTCCRSLEPRPRRRSDAFALYLDGRTVTAELAGGKWEVDQSEHPWGVPAEPLVYKPRVGRPFGASRISRPVMSLHDQALRTVIRMEGHADVYSFPEMWLLGADESIFKNPDGTQKAAWQVMLGRIKAIPDDEDASNPRAEVKQIQASSPQPHIDQLKVQASLFAGETDLPVTALGVQAETNTTTADGSDNAERQLVAEAEGATDDWGPGLARATRRALAMANGLTEVPREWGSVAPKWRSPMYLSRAAQADAGMKQLAAVPWLAETEIGLELLGLDAQQVQRAMAEKRRAQGSLALQAIAAAAAKGQPVVTGVGDNTAG
jgi:hypothetical protein